MIIIFVMKNELAARIDLGIPITSILKISFLSYILQSIQYRSYFCITKSDRDEKSNTKGNFLSLRVRMVCVRLTFVSKAIKSSHHIPPR